jgi:hypothetical protein
MDDNTLRELRELLLVSARAPAGYQWGDVGPVEKVEAVVPLTQQVLDDAAFFNIREILHRRRSYLRRFAALPPMAQAVVRGVQETQTAERNARYEADRCSCCGCHPDEHGDR